MSNEQIKKIADETHEAFSRSRYTDAGWAGIIKRLAREGASEAEIVWILRSKHMRWAADEANREHSATAADFARYVVTRIKGTLPWQELIEEAREELTPKTGANLAGACEGEDIAELIDLARMVGNGVTGPKVRQIASSLVARIQARAK